ncbi:TetR/AcrR family transcriptional regulator [Streptomonospora wellingtoniae]|uniref:TetR family transcriptional regulator n=1 Tax=Streptomonospora wellingtoniae TaxID=3075544 RepID=A0ABU2KNL9_9ACTN|nr:TetR family transcriptional regulator [Streptomonospora sp. DSM 45055]MDT0300864.1 TetR family transcriptional regulator [Streptomonospora sp. DSM 45055]
MRTDARRNREELLRAARALFVERGADVALEAVAQRAGVSIATLYRNFPDRSALVRAIVLEGIGSMDRAARRARDGLAEDPAGAWRTFVETAAGLQAGVLMPMLVPMLPDLATDPELRRARDAVVDAVRDLVAAAQRRGQVRSDVAADEILLLIMAIARPLPALPQEHVPEFIDRALAVAVAGLRPGSGPALPGRPVAMRVPGEECADRPGE